jgi:hypothetical protein
MASNRTQDIHCLVEVTGGPLLNSSAVKNEVSKVAMRLLLSSWTGYTEIM